MNEWEYNDRIERLRERMINLQWKFTGLIMDISAMPNRKELFDHAYDRLNKIEELIDADWPKTTDIASLIKGTSE